MSEITRDSNRVVVKPEGDIVASIVDDLKDVFKKALSDGATEITVDLSRVEMMDSMGIGVLIAAHNSLKKIDRQLELINASADILKLLKNMRLDQHFKIV